MEQCLASPFCLHAINTHEAVHSFSPPFIVKGGPMRLLSHANRKEKAEKAKKKKKPLNQHLMKSETQQYAIRPARASMINKNS